jgi:uncharacterized protein (DUF934 family)
MRRIIRRREIRADDWRYPGEEGPGPLVQPLAEFTAAVNAGEAPAAGAGVRLAPADAVEQFAPYLQRVALVVVEFPQSGDGRGFTHAQLLRQRYRYTGELRAAGAIKRDQLFFLARCGFDAFDLDPSENLEAALAAFDTFSVAYQSASGPPLRGLRAVSGAGSASVEADD